MKIKEISEEEIQKKFNEIIINNKINHVVGASSILSIITGIAFGVTTFTTLGAIALGLLAIAIITCKTKAKNIFIKKILKEIQNQQDNIIENKSKDIDKKLQRIQASEIVTGNKKINAFQFSKLKKKVENLKYFIEKTNKSEEDKIKLNITARNILEGAIENIEKILDIYKIISGIEIKELNKKIKSSNNPSEIDTLKERVGVYTHGIDKINKYLSTNEEAITQVDKLALHLTGDTNENVNMEKVLHDITNNFRLDNQTQSTNQQSEKLWT